MSATVFTEPRQDPLREDVRAPAPPDLPAAWLMTFFLVSSIWASSRLVGIVALAGALALLIAGRYVLEKGSKDIPDHIGTPGWIAVLAGLIVLLPVAAFLFLTWEQDFPFTGDHDYHLAKSVEALEFWSGRFVPVLLLIIIVWWNALRSDGRPWVVPVVFILVAALGWWNMERVTFAVRYPGSLYFLAIPFVSLWQFLGADDPLNALRLTNALAIPVWLFVLRPLILRRWPDTAAVLFSIYFFLQKDVIYYFTASLPGALGPDSGSPCGRAPGDLWTCVRLACLSADRFGGYVQRAGDSAAPFRGHGDLARRFET